MHLTFILFSLLNASAVTRSFTTIALNTMILAQTEVKNITQFKEIAGKIVAVVIILGYVAAVGFLVAGLMKRANEPDEAKKMFITAGLIAIAPAILTLLFFLGGLGDATVKANFKD
jgi:Na+/proline symporter